MSGRSCHLHSPASHFFTLLPTFSINILYLLPIIHIYMHVNAISPNDHMASFHFHPCHVCATCLPYVHAAPCCIQLIIRRPISDAFHILCLL
ncbi:uncharacterized protein BO88DRAFT_99501 [Aspergillus vadensis CBS 113365]|uniref:Uncharacterized protein n=1 Tax=Aspergillus vadensis (strain CBS 113365 / IMI 142717 / IBT 24658) TaxID=1448311 RepID=A0A319D067_ASPVC|nr:hypothetical protein BO88DRAFT_99501 [Aspergillus vadensis CBS 113365]PYH73542.1 hypothetical protein BO88DRAFT_99501 [Aspergillus vadensis CBS 113365]